MTRSGEGTRLERLWAGEFGDEYRARNQDAARGRDRFWRELLPPLEIRNALEVGCNVGGNLVWLAELLGAENVAAVDVNEGALEVVRETLPNIDARLSGAHSLPFADRAFELTFTTGVLIHLPDDRLEEAIGELVRCSGRFVFCGEYYSEEPVEIPYRGETGALFKRDYGAIYQRAHPDLALCDSGFLSAEDDGGAWDDITWWLFEKP